MKAFLKGSDGLLALRPKITTIGRHEESDIVVKSAGIEDHHAAVEFSSAENCFILRDFNSVQGTFVNGCQIQNAAVKLSPGDILRFGFNGPVFELVLENASQASRPPASRPPALPGSLQVVSETKAPSPPPPLSGAAAPQFPSLPSPQSLPAAHSWTYGLGGSSSHPPRRKRPINAWGKPVSSPSFAPDPFSRTSTVVAGSGGAVGPLTNIPQGNALLREKDEVILKMGNEISRLSGFESECNRKDAVIADLQNEIAAMREKLTASLPPKESELRQKLVGLDQDAASRAEEIKTLKEEINLTAMELCQDKYGLGFFRQAEKHRKHEGQNILISRISNLQKNTSEVLYHSLSERDLQIAHWKQENEALKKNHSMTIGLVTSLQKEVTLKEQKVQELKTDAEKLRRESREKDNQLAHLSAQCSRIKEETKRELRDREVNPCKNRIASLELQVKKSEEEIKKFSEEQKALAKRLAEKTQAEGDLKEECERRSQQLQEMGRRERLIKSDMELAATQAQCFRNQVIETLFLQLPDKFVTDQEIVEKLKEMHMNDEEHFRKEIALKEEIDTKECKIQEIFKNMELLKKSLHGFQDFLKTSYCSGTLRKEVSLFQKICLSPPASEIQALTSEVLHSLLTWVDAVEGLLHDVGLDISGSETGIASYLKKLLDQHHNTMNQLQALQNQIRTTEESQHLLLQEKLKELKEKLEDTFRDKEKELLEAEKEHRKVLEGMSALQEVTLTEAIEEEKKKVKDLEKRMEQLTVVIEQKTKSEAVLNAKITEHLESLETAERRKTLAEEKLIVWKKRLEGAEKEAAMQKQKHEEEVSEYKEQVRQHSRTIVDLEGKATEAVEHLKKVKEEKINLQKQLEEMRRESNKSVPAASRVASCTDGSHVFLKEELKTAKEKILSSEAVIAELKTELSEARAKVSDVIGELGEKQKLELEQKRQLVHSQVHELNLLQEQLFEMAKHVQQKDAELKKASEALRKSREQLQEMKTEARGKAEEKIQQHKSVQTSTPLSDEVPVSKKGPALDLAGLGARCKGSRHEETIQRQKDALAELRQRIRRLEKAHPPGFEERTTEPLIVLKKGLAEKDTDEAEEKQVMSLLMPADAKKLPSGIAIRDPNVIIERTAKLEMAEALDFSENLYHQLIQELASLMNVKEELGAGLQTVKHLPQDEREKVGLLRQKDAELLFDKINKLKQCLERKESLLNEYERDMGKFRTRKQTLQAYQSEIAKLGDKVYRESEEKALLKEALERTQLQLAQEKRLNRALKHHKNTEEKMKDVSSCYACTLKSRDRKTATPKQQLPENQVSVERPDEAQKKTVLHSTST